MSERGTASGGGIRILPMGERALLAEVGGVDEVLALRAALSADPFEGVEDVVPAARTVLATFDPHRVTAAAVRAWLERAGDGAADAPAAPSDTTPVVLDIAYDGPDLAETAEILGVGPGELAERHERAAWTVAFTGFAPGFGYLTSPDWPFEVPRLDAPRTRVPEGSVGLAGEFSGAYPRETPGGWRLIGTTTASLFDGTAARPARLTPGDPVRFRRADGSRLPVIPTSSSRARAGSAPSAPTASTASTAPSAIRVIEPGLLATVQDLGRPGHASIGVARSGALDRRALRIANRLVGNAEGAAGIEVTMGGFRAVAGRDLWIASGGGFGPLSIDGSPVDAYTAHEWPRGSELRLGWLDHGSRAYLAVRGGIVAGERDAARPWSVLGSLATDTLARLGPDPLRGGDRLAVGPAPQTPVPPLDVSPWGPPGDERELELAPGPRADWFPASALSLLFDAVWTVSGDADRVGVRLEGPELPRTTRGELPSEGMVPGALQVPPRGRPTVLLADGPVTGGYPVIAVVTDASLDALGQARPGTRIRFRHPRPGH